MTHSHIFIKSLGSTVEVKQVSTKLDSAPSSITHKVKSGEYSSLIFLGSNNARHMGLTLFLPNSSVIPLEQNDDPTDYNCFHCERNRRGELATSIGEVLEMDSLSEGHDSKKSKNAKSGSLAESLMSAVADNLTNKRKRSQNDDSECIDSKVPKNSETPLDLAQYNIKLLTTQAQLVKTAIAFDTDLYDVSPLRHRQTAESEKDLLSHTMYHFVMQNHIMANESGLSREDAVRVYKHPFLYTITDIANSVSIQDLFEDIFENLQPLSSSTYADGSKYRDKEFRGDSSWILNFTRVVPIYGWKGGNQHTDKDMLKSLLSAPQQPEQALEHTCGSLNNYYIKGYKLVPIEAYLTVCVYDQFESKPMKDIAKVHRALRCNPGVMLAHSEEISTEGIASGIYN